MKLTADERGESEAVIRKRSGSAALARRVKELELEGKELRRANEILKVASAFFAQAELARRFKT